MNRRLIMRIALLPALTLVLLAVNMIVVLPGSVQAEDYGRLQVMPNVDGVSIYVDGEFGGSANAFPGATVQGLIQGTYTLKLTKEGYKEWTKQVSVTAGQTTTVYAYLESGTGSSVTRNETISVSSGYGRLQVMPNVDGVSIYVDDEFGGSANAFPGAAVNGLIEGTYTLKLTKDGYKEWTKQVSITTGQTTTVYAYLEPGAGQTPTPAPTTTVTPMPTPTPIPVPTATPAVPPPSPDETTFIGSIPLPKEVSTDPKVIGTNVALALVLIVVFRFAAALFNDTIKANYEIIRGWLGRTSGLFKPLIEFASRKTSGLQKVKARGYLKILLSVSLCALIYCYLDSYFSYDLKGLALFLSLSLAIGIVTNCYEGGQSFFGRALYDIRSRFKIYPIAIFIAIVFVVFSRAINFHPGLIYGFVGGYVISLGPMKSDRADERGEVRKAAIVVLWGALLIVSVALLAFFLRAFVPQASEGGMSFWVSLADGILVGVFAGGLEGLFFSLVPLTFLDGAKITAWKWWVWPFVMAPVAFLFWHIILNREGTFSDVISNMEARMMWGLMGFFLLLSVVTWLYFRWRYKNKPREAAVTQPTTPAVAHVQYCPKCREAVSEGSNFCAKCGAPLRQSAE